MLATLQILGIMPLDLTHSPVIDSLASPSNTTIDSPSVKSLDARIELGAIRTATQPVQNTPSTSGKRQDQVVKPGTSRCRSLSEYGDGRSHDLTLRPSTRKTRGFTNSSPEMDLRSTTLVASRELFVEQVPGTPAPEGQKISTNTVKRRKLSIKEMKAELANLAQEEAEILREEQEAREDLRRRQVNSDPLLLRLCSKLLIGCRSRRL